MIGKSNQRKMFKKPWISDMNRTCIPWTKFLFDILGMFSEI